MVSTDDKARVCINALSADMCVTGPIQTAWKSAGQPAGSMAAGAAGIPVNSAVLLLKDVCRWRT